MGARVLFVLVFVSDKCEVTGKGEKGWICDSAGAESISSEPEKDLLCGFKNIFPNYVCEIILQTFIRWATFLTWSNIWG